MTDKCTSPEGHEWEPTYITFTRPTKPPAFARCTRCRTVLGKDKVVAMLNEHAALKRELRKKTQHVCSHCGYVTVSQDVEEAFASLKRENKDMKKMLKIMGVDGYTDDALLAAEEPTP